MRCLRFFPLALFVLSAWTPTPACADGLVRDGVGAISIGRGGTNLGFADNGAIIMDNPGAMTNVKGNGLLDVGVDGVITDLRYTDPNNSDVRGAFSIFPSGMFGYVHHDPDSRLAYGIGMYAPAGFGARYKMNNSVMGPSLYKSIGALGKILPAVAVQVTDRLSIGGSAGLAIGHVELEGPFYTQTGPMAGLPNLLDLQCTGVAATGNVGIQYKLTPKTTLGVAYTTATRFNFNGNASSTMYTPLGRLHSEFDANVQIIWPRSLGFGFKHELCKSRRFGFDFIWYDWSDAFKQLDMTMTNPTNPTVAALAGKQIHDAYPMGWRDTFSFRFGYEWTRRKSRTWRVGYVYHRSPVSNATLNPYTDGVLEHAVSVGLSQPTDYGLVNLAYQFTWGPKRTIGHSDILGGDFDNSTFAASAHWLSISFLMPQ
jgi:long-subunit fatty acid transport protein